MNEYTHFLVVKFYESGKYIPSMDKLYYYDLHDDESFQMAFCNGACYIQTITGKNEKMTARLEIVKNIRG
jgi:hypothetical protein